MTLWARKTDFKSAFELLNVDTEWSVDIEESAEEVTFVITPHDDVVLDVEDFTSSHAVAQMTSCGADGVVMDLSSNPCFEVTVEREKLPDDYDV